jgi:competence protein ComEC
MNLAGHSFSQSFLDFWRAHPALFIGAHLLLGSALALHGHWIYPVLWILLWVPLLSFPLKFHAILKMSCFSLLVLAAWGYAAFTYPTVHLPSKALQGSAYFSISNLKISQSPFQRSYLYQGIIKSFESSGDAIFRNLSCKIHVPLQNMRNSAKQDYLIEGILYEKGDRSFVFKPHKNSDWVPIKDSFSCAEWRYLAKEKVQHYLKDHIHHRSSQAFLNALLTGDMEERNMFLEFGRLGLQHILAISGFHFGLLAAFCAFFLRLFLSPRMTAAVSLIILSAYFFFIGGSPSVQRAWIVIFIFLCGNLCNLKCSGLNALGCALILEILIDPLIIVHLGFQLSFLCAFAILLFYPQLNLLLGHLLPSRPKSVIANMNLFNQHGYLLSAVIRNALALNLSVHLFTAPAVLYYFHKLPLLSLAYNLFIPLLAAISFFLLLISLLFTGVHPINDSFTAFWLELISNSPAYIDFFIRIRSFPFSLLALFLFFLAMTGIYLKQKRVRELN